MCADSPGVSCDACGKGGFSGKRFKCLLCYDFDLCSDCHEAGETGSGRHSTVHPMQCILTRVDAGEKLEKWKALNANPWRVEPVCARLEVNARA